MRVHEAAKKLNIESKDLIAALAKHGVEVKNHMSAITDGDFEKAKKEFVKTVEPKKPLHADVKLAAAPATVPVKHEPKPEVKHEVKHEIKKEEPKPVTVVKPQPIPVIKPQPAPVAPKVEPAKPAVVQAPAPQPEVKAEEKAVELPREIIEVGRSSTVSELAVKLEIKPIELIKKLFSLGMMATMNQTLSEEEIHVVVEELGKSVLFKDVYGEDIFAEDIDKPEDLKPRAPIVTIMGHVDHGKTSLLDAIRETNVAGGEKGGITQKIGAYKVATSHGEIVFLDTPGHEAFTAMRARGAKSTDIVVLIVAADDGIMPQTVEAIDHAKAAGAPIIVAINKMDKDGANPEKIKQELTKYNLVSEAWGGKTQIIPISAKKRTGINELLEGILLEAEILELKTNPTAQPFGVVIEGKLDKGRGPVGTILLQKGNLKVGDSFLTNFTYGN